MVWRAEGRQAACWERCILTAGNVDLDRICCCAKGLHGRGGPCRGAGIGNALGLVRLVKAARLRAAAAAGRHLPPPGVAPGFAAAARRGSGAGAGGNARQADMDGDGDGDDDAGCAVAEALAEAAAALDAAAGELRSPAVEGGGPGRRRLGCPGPLIGRAGRAKADRVCVNARLEEAPPDQTADVMGIVELLPSRGRARARMGSNARQEPAADSALGALGRLASLSGAARPRLGSTLHGANDVRGQVWRRFLLPRVDTDMVCLAPPGCGLTPCCGALVVVACADWEAASSRSMLGDVHKWRSWKEWRSSRGCRGPFRTHPRRCSAPAEARRPGARGERSRRPLPVWWCPAEAPWPLQLEGVVQCLRAPGSRPWNAALRDFWSAIRNKTLVTERLAGLQRPPSPAPADCHAACRGRPRLPGGAGARVPAGPGGARAGAPGLRVRRRARAHAGRGRGAHDYLSFIG